MEKCAANCDSPLASEVSEFIVLTVLPVFHFSRLWVCQIGSGPSQNPTGILQHHIHNVKIVHHLGRVKTWFQTLRDWYGGHDPILRPLVRPCYLCALC